MSDHFERARIVGQGNGSFQARGKAPDKKEEIWICPRCDKEFSMDSPCYETSNGDYICQSCMEFLEAQAEMTEDR